MGILLKKKKWQEQNKAAYSGDAYFNDNDEFNYDCLCQDKPENTPDLIVILEKEGNEIPLLIMDESNIREKERYEVRQTAYYYAAILLQKYDTIVIVSEDETLPSQVSFCDIVSLHYIASETEVKTLIEKYCRSFKMPMEFYDLLVHHSYNKVDNMIEKVLIETFEWGVHRFNNTLYATQKVFSVEETMIIISCLVIASMDNNAACLYKYKDREHNITAIMQAVMKRDQEHRLLPSSQKKIESIIDNFLSKCPYDTLMNVTENIDEALAEISYSAYGYLAKRLFLLGKEEGIDYFPSDIINFVVDILEKQNRGWADLLDNVISDANTTWQNNSNNAHIMRQSIILRHSIDPLLELALIIADEVNISIEYKENVDEHNEHAKNRNIFLDLGRCDRYGDEYYNNVISQGESFFCLIEKAGYSRSSHKQERHAVLQFNTLLLSISLLQGQYNLFFFKKGTPHDIAMPVVFMSRDIDDIIDGTKGDVSRILDKGEYAQEYIRDKNIIATVDDISLEGDDWEADEHIYVNQPDNETFDEIFENQLRKMLDL